MKNKLFHLTLATALSFIACNNQTETKESTAEQPASATPASETAAPVPATSAAFSQELKYEKISFQVSSPQLTANNTALVIPSGFTIVNDSVRIPINGTVTKAEIADISGDNAPELLIVSRDEKGNGYAYMFSGNGNASLSAVYIRDISDNTDIMNGYQGEDEFALVESVMARRFPIFKDGIKTGKTR